jgi:hypothetical protein
MERTTQFRLYVNLIYCYLRRNLLGYRNVRISATYSVLYVYIIRSSDITNNIK